MSGASSSEEVAAHPADRPVALASSTDNGAPLRVSPRCIETLSASVAWRPPGARHAVPIPANDWDAASEPPPRKLTDAPAPMPRGFLMLMGFAAALLLCFLGGAVLRL